MGDFIRLLISVSEKASFIARVIRQDEELFSMLIEEKESLKKNETVVQDFKTFADVLIQETVRHDLSSLILGENIYGEESNLFTNNLGECVRVTVGETKEETRQIIRKVLGENSKAADILAEEVHRIVLIDDDEAFERIPCDLIDAYENLGIWIDPIDATSEYIKGRGHEEPESFDEEQFFSQGGLPCATVLIGVFQLDTGCPIIGVINQPFWKFSPMTNSWTGRHFWGISIGDRRISNLGILKLPDKVGPNVPVIMISESEDKSIQRKLSPHCRLVEAPGAGYKLLCVIIGLADFYIISKSSTHVWDTCAPHAILKSLGGGIEDLKEILEDSNNLSNHEISYSPDDSDRKALKYANTGGLFAYRNKTYGSLVLDYLKTD